MTVWGVSCTRDEADILEASVRHMLTECDHVLVEDHGSIDTTPEILGRLDAEFDTLTVQTGTTFDSRLGWLATQAAAAGATWIVPFDTDEIWQAPDRLRDLLPHLDADHVVATVHEHVPGDDEADPLRTMVWRRGYPWPWTKVAVRVGVAMSIGHHEADGVRPYRGPIGVRHFPWRSVTQAKLRLARNIEHSETTEHARLYEGIYARFDEWWGEIRDPTGLVYDPARLGGTQ